MLRLRVTCEKLMTRYLIFPNSKGSPHSRSSNSLLLSWTRAASFGCQIPSHLFFTDSVFFTDSTPKASTSRTDLSAGGELARGAAASSAAFAAACKRSSTLVRLACPDGRCRGGALGASISMPMCGAGKPQLVAVALQSL